MTNLSDEKHSYSYKEEDELPTYKDEKVNYSYSEKNKSEKYDSSDSEDEDEDEDEDRAAKTEKLKLSQDELPPPYVGKLSENEPGASSNSIFKSVKNLCYRSVGLSMKCNIQINSKDEKKYITNNEIVSGMLNLQPIKESVTVDSIMIFLKGDINITVANVRRKYRLLRQKFIFENPNKYTPYDTSLISPFPFTFPFPNEPDSFQGNESLLGSQNRPLYSNKVYLNDSVCNTLPPSYYYAFTSNDDLYELRVKYWITAYAIGKGPKDKECKKISNKVHYNIFFLPSMTPGFPVPISTPERILSEQIVKKLLFKKTGHVTIEILQRKPFEAANESQMIILPVKLHFTLAKPTYDYPKIKYIKAQLVQYNYFHNKQIKNIINRVPSYEYVKSFKVANMDFKESSDDSWVPNKEGGADRFIDLVVKSRKGKNIVPDFIMGNAFIYYVLRIEIHTTSGTMVSSTRWNVLTAETIRNYNLTI